MILGPITSSPPCLRLSLAYWTNPIINFIAFALARLVLKVRQVEAPLSGDSNDLPLESRRIITIKMQMRFSRAVYLHIKKCYMATLRIGLVLFFVLNAFTGAGFSEAGETFMFGKKKTMNQYNKKNWLIGPNLGLGGGNRAFSIYLAPTMAYAFTDRFHAGSTLGINYFQQTLFYSNFNNNLQERYRYKMPIYTFSVFGRYHIANMLVLNVEPQLTWAKFMSNSPYERIPSNFDANTGRFVEKKQRALLPSFFVGGGYAQHIGRNAYSYMIINYDLVQNPNLMMSNQFLNIPYLDFRFGLLLDLFN